jgi:DNA-binding response OmpR family regulator
MGISGSLKDVSVADVMQFIHLGRRTGTLLLSRGSERAMIGFHSGRLISAQAPRTPKLGDLLVTSGVIDRGILDSAIRTQSEQQERSSLGQILIAAGSIDVEGLRQVIARQIEQAVSEVMVWEAGTFEFAIDDMRPIDDIALYPSDIFPDADINTQMVLLEAARIFDERNRDQPAFRVDPREARSAAPQAGFDGDSTHPTYLDVTMGGQLRAAGEVAEQALQRVAPRYAAERLRLQVVSADVELSELLAEALRDEVAVVEMVTLEEAGLVPSEEPPPIVLVDLRGDAGGVLQAVTDLRRAHNRSSFVALVDPEMQFAKVYEEGILAALPAEVAAVVACIENVIESRRDLMRGAPRSDSRSGVARLRRVFGDLRSGLISATVALNLMHIISESVERAVLFLVKRDHLAALGAFGTDARGRPLAELTRALKLSLDSETSLTRSVETGEVQNIAFAEALLPPSFSTLIGPPRSGQVVIFPVLGAQRVISVIYADNGDRLEPIEDIEILELATAQVGMAFENELLRRQISQHRD